MDPHREGEAMPVHTVNGASLVYNRRYGLVICQKEGCGHALGKDVVGHLRAKHKMKLSKHDAEALRNTLNALGYTGEPVGMDELLTQSASFAPVVQGITVLPGHMCLLCNAVFKRTAKSGREHLKACHTDSQVHWTAVIQECNVQQIFKPLRGHTEAIFRRVHAEIPEGPTTQQSAMLDALDSMVSNEIEPSAATIGELNELEYKLRWNQRFPPQMRSSLQDLLLAGEGMDAAVAAYFSECEQVWQQCPYTILGWLSAEQNGPFNRYFKTVDTAGARNKYSAVLSKFLSFVVAISEEGSMQVHVSQRIRSAVNQFVSSTQNRDIFFGDVHRLLLALVLDRQSLATTNSSVAVCFVAVMSHLGTNGLKEAGVITQYIAALKYAFRLCVLYETGKFLDSVPEEQCIEHKSDIPCMKGLDETGVTNFGQLDQLSSLISSVASRQDVVAQVVYDKEKERVLVQNIWINADKVKMLVMKSATECKRLLKLLMDGVRSVVDPAKLSEDRGNHTEGVSIVSINKLEGLCVSVEKKWIKEQNGRMTLEDGRLGYEHAHAMQYLRKVDIFLEHMFMLIHCTGGLPARCESEKSIALKNTGTTRRGIFVFDKSVMIVNHSSKNRSITQVSEQSVRLLSARIGMMLLKYIVYVAPVAQRMSSQVHEHADYGTWLFCRKGKHLGGGQLCSIFQKRWADRFGGSIGILNYRQAIEVLAKAKIPMMTQGPMDIHAQHSTRTADIHYGNAAHEIGTVGKDSLRLMIEASKLFNNMLGLEGHDVTEQDADSSFPVIEQGMAFVAPAEPVTDMMVVNEHCSRAREGLKALYGPDAAFQSNEQLLGLCHCLRAHDDLLVVLRTGAGKSMLYLAPAAIEEAVTVLVVPLVVLVQECVLKSRKHGIRAQQYRHGMTIERDTTLVIVGVEMATSDQFRGALKAWNHLLGVRRIVIDEAHIYAASRGYRDAMHSMNLLRSIPVPIVLLTATCSREFEKELSNVFASSFKTVRGCTDRRNLKYTVRKVRDSGQVSEKIAERIQAFLQTSTAHERCIVYFMSKSELEEFSEQLEATDVYFCTYTGDMGRNERMRNYDAFVRAQGAQVMLATSAFGCGVDYDDVSLVIHCQGTYSVYDYAQQVGRGGRKGQLCECLLLWSSGDIEDDGMRRFMQGNSQCRRGLLQQMLDGVPVLCISGAAEAFCDVCSGEANRIQEQTLQADVLDAWDISLSSENDGYAAVQEARLNVQPVSASVHAAFRESTETSKDLSTVGARMSGLLSEFGNIVRDEARGELTGKSTWTCMICAVNGKARRHQDIKRDCPEVRGKCFSCLERWTPGHQCPVKRPYSTAVCSHCFLPKDINGVVLHRNMGRKCDSGAAPFSHQFLMWVFVERGALLKRHLDRRGVHFDCTDKQAYVDWLLCTQKGLVNSVHVYDAFEGVSGSE